MKNSLKRALIAGAATLAVVSSATTTYATVDDHVFFRVHGVVIVWGTDSATGTTAVASDFVLMDASSNNPGNDLTAANVRAVITGTLNGAPATDANGTRMSISNQTSGGAFTDNGATGYLDAADALTAFGLDATTDVTLHPDAMKHSFYVASNTAFDIYAQASNLSTTDDFTTLTLGNIDFDLSITTSGDDGVAFGGNAQDPSTGGTGVITTIDDLSDISTTAKVFDGGQRTAASVGTIAGHSVRFDAVYALNNGTVGQPYDFSQGSGLIEADVAYTVYVP